MIQIMGSLDDFKEIYSDNETETTNEEKKVINSLEIPVIELLLEYAQE